jgi:hypothetical protein
MGKISQAVVSLEVHFADKSERLRNAWAVVHAELAEGQKPTPNTGSLQCQAANCGGVAEVHLCRECFDSMNSIVRLPRQADA